MFFHGKVRGFKGDQGTRLKCNVAAAGAAAYYSAALLQLWTGRSHFTL